MLLKLKQLVLFYIPAADADTPSNLMVRQNGRLSIEINWTPTATTPSQGYQITTVEDVSVWYNSNESSLHLRCTRHSSWKCHQYLFGSPFCTLLQWSTWPRICHHIG